jgi:hypothetical protein
MCSVLLRLPCNFDGACAVSSLLRTLIFFLSNSKITREGDGACAVSRLVTFTVT